MKEKKGLFGQSVIFVVATAILYLAFYAANLLIQEYRPTHNIVTTVERVETQEVNSEPCNGKHIELLEVEKNALP